MKQTPSLIIVTADDFPLGTEIDRACETFAREAGEGKHLYGGKHYFGHHVVLRKWVVAKSLRAQIALNRLSLPISPLTLPAC